MVFFVRITVNQSHLRPICKSTKFNPKIQRTIYLINFQQLRLHVPDFIRTVVVSNIKIPTCDFDELSWLKQYLEKRMDMLLLELKNEVSSVSFEPEDIAGLPISSDDKIKLLDMLHGLWFDVYKVCQEK